jgi:hypothetical protein
MAERKFHGFEDHMTHRFGRFTAQVRLSTERADSDTRPRSVRREGVGLGRRTDHCTDHRADRTCLEGREVARRAMGAPGIEPGTSRV